MESDLNEQLVLFDKNYQIKTSPNHTFGDLHHNLDIYMYDAKDAECEVEAKIYPTSDDGRVRKVMYFLSIFLVFS